MTSPRYESGLTGTPIEIWLAAYGRQRAFAEHALNQLDDEQFFRAPAPGLNSPAVIAKHMAGNMRSRFTDFLTSDGEKPDRDRDTEFDAPDPGNEPARSEARRAIMDSWGGSWKILESAIAGLANQDLHCTVTIRGAPHTVRAAITRSIDHYAFHIGQLNIIARLYVGSENWKWFTIPPGGTKSFNEDMKRRHG